MKYEITLLIQSNGKVELDYGDLAYGAMKAGMLNIQSNEEMNKVTNAIKDYQEEVLKLKSSDFERICLQSEDIERLWQISLSAETSLFPEQDITMNDLRSDFDKTVRTSLCKVGRGEDSEARRVAIIFQTFWRCTLI